MKAFRLCAVMALAVTLLTSCLGDSDSVENYYSIPGAIVYHNGKEVIETYRGNIYSPGIFAEGLYEGDCVLVSFVLDTKTEGNDYASYQKNGYYNVSLMGIAKMDNGVVGFQTDTTRLMSDEFVLQDGHGSSHFQNCFYSTNGSLILTSVFAGLDEQKNQFYLYIDPEQEPEQMMTSEGQANVYKAIMRAAVTTDGKKPEKNQAQINAYRIKNQMSIINSREKALGSKLFGLDIVYLSKIDDKEDEENPVLTWKKSETGTILTLTEDN